MPTPPELAAAIASRICHDLVSPVGAVVNGVDLLKELGGGDVSAEVAMIGQSAERASGLLQFYRVAFGEAEADTHLARTQVAHLISEFMRAVRVDCLWPDLIGDNLSRPEARILCLMTMCGRAVLGMRGQVVITVNPEAGFPMVVEAMGENATLSAEHRTLLTGDAPAEARAIEFALLATHAHQSGASLDAHEEPGRVTFRALKG